MKTNCVLTAGLIVLILSINACYSPSGPSGYYIIENNPIEDNPIKIGFIGPLTGEASSFGLVEQRVTQMAIDDINSNGGISGRKIEIISEDGKCTGKDAATAAQKLVSIDKVKILFVTCSSEVLASAPIAEENKVLLFTAWANNPAISNAGDFVFRNGFSDTVTAHVASESVRKNHRSVGIIYEQSSYATGLKDAFVKSFEDLGGEVFEEGYSQNSQDVRTQVTKILSNNPDAVFIDPDTSITGLAILRELKTQGYTGSNTGGLYGNYIGEIEEVVASPDAEGMIFFSNPMLPESHPRQELFNRYRQRFGVNVSIEYAAAARYDVSLITKQALEKVGDDPEKIRNYLYNMSNFTGLLGTYHFDHNGDAVGNNATGLTPTVKVIRDKRVDLYEQIGEPR